MISGENFSLHDILAHEEHVSRTDIDIEPLAEIVHKGMPLIHMKYKDMPHFYKEMCRKIAWSVVLGYENQTRSL